MHPIRPHRPWFRVLHPLIDALSNARLGKSRMASLDGTLFDPSTLAPHEGLHRLTDPRYKEWWYYDIHLSDGTVVSMAIVFSIVQTHWFVWVYDPATRQISEEIVTDGPVTVNEWGGSGLEMKGQNFAIRGSVSRGYRLSFNGKTRRGQFEFTDPIPGRCECHRGVSNTRYGLYQVARLRVSGEFADSDGKNVRPVTGEGYHDHWWCIAHRVTRWNWLQAKFPGNWVAGFYDAAYGYDAEDLHRYAWLFSPENRYFYFDNSTMRFVKQDQGWSLDIRGPSGAFHLDATPRVKRYQYKPVARAGVLLGEVQYYQYPIAATARFSPPGGPPIELATTSGILEWDWLAVW